jgi:hypothetical protein
MTVGELRAALDGLPDGMTVEAYYDCRCASGFVASTEIGPAPSSGLNDDTAAFLLVID